MNSREYWERRALLRKVQAERSALRTADEIGEAYDRAAASLQKEISYWLSRFAQNNELSLTDAKKLLKADELKEFRWTVEEYISHGEQNADGRWAKQLENASARVHISRLEAMRTLLRAEAEALSGKGLNAVESLLSDTYREQYLLRAFDLQRGLGVGWSVQRPDPRMVKILLKKPWAADGEVFSERIWKDKESLVRELDRALTQSLITGKSPDAAAQMLVDKLGAGKRQARRLVFTEAAAVSTLAEKDCYTDLGVGEYEILATLDSKTSEICRSMDGRHFPVSEMKPGVTAPPFHPNCRTDTCPYFDDMAGERFARDAVTGESFMVPGNMTYAQWKARQDELHGAGTVDKMRKISYNEAADREQFERYKAIFGAKFPKNFDAFQQMKYNDSDRWEQFKAIARSKNHLQQQLSYIWNGEKLFIPQYAKFEKVTTMAGAGTEKPIRDIKRLIHSYGSTADQWKKQAGKISSAKYIFDIHWYECEDGIQHDVKLKNRTEKKK